MTPGPRAADRSSSRIDLPILGHLVEDDCFSSSFRSGRRRFGLWSSQIRGLPGSQAGSGLPQILQRASPSPDFSTKTVRAAIADGPRGGATPDPDWGEG
jgi:hypothetical protein